MNTFKNILFFGLLFAGLCGVYLSLNRSSDPGVPQGLSGDTKYPSVDMGAPLGPTPAGNGAAGFSTPPPMSVPPSNAALPAPAYRPPVSAGPPSMAPPFPSEGASSTFNPSLPAPPAMPSSPNERPGVGNSSDPSLPPPLPTPPSFGATPPRDDRSPPFVASAPPQDDHSASASLEPIMQQVKLKVGENRLADALLILTQLYANPDVPPSQAREVTQLLDQLGGKVIYSREHWLESPYLVQAGDTLDTISDRYQVPAMLLARINGIRDPQNLPPGRELKVIKGPFSAHVSTDRSEMTLMLAGRYAGRFNVVLSNDLSHATNLFTVREKGPPPAAGLVSPPAYPGTKQWIELANAGGKISVLATNDTRVTTGRDSRATIWLSEQDMDDVFGILSVGSRVIIQR